ncbi:hypothetical protein LTR62_004222 [Meristemomyces frigidus]|uniref:BAH domain-containing protein n=1 Tax=Meristemomyces frigidus TaxID=1508187 RepID=A0AAN7YGD2_9PEZI|nr:hypothetical protein LTR62_004222 [Meristemomyces frigidus]
MRTKQTGVARTKATPRAQDTPPIPDRKSPTQTQPQHQPHELSEKERVKLKDFLERGDGPPFTVTTIAPSKKRKRASTTAETQDNLFEPRLSVQYEVKPHNNWQSLRRYKKFTVGDQSIAVGETILVKPSYSPTTATTTTTTDSDPDPETTDLNLAAQWKAQVLEVRALDPEHVYLRVAWLNRPEDLDTGRKDYHGVNELIPTNQMDIIDAMTVNGKLEVYAWEEANDESEMPGIGEFFWRQTFDAVGTRTFSTLRHICTDSTPQNPDQMVLQCPSPACGKWMHLKCIAEAAIAPNSAQSPLSATKSNSVGKKVNRKPKTPDLTPGPNAQAKSVNPVSGVSAEVFIRGLRDGLGEEAGEGKGEERTRTVVTNADGGVEERDVACLFCGVAVD